MWEPNGQCAAGTAHARRSVERHVVLPSPRPASPRPCWQAAGLHFEKVGSAVIEGAGHADVAEGALDAVHAEDMSLLRLPASGSAAGGGGLRLGDARGRAVLQVGPACTTRRVTMAHGRWGIASATTAP